MASKCSIQRTYSTRSSYLRIYKNWAKCFPKASTRSTTQILTMMMNNKKWHENSSCSNPKRHEYKRSRTVIKSINVNHHECPASKWHGSSRMIIIDHPSWSSLAAVLSVVRWSLPWTISQDSAMTPKWHRYLSMVTNDERITTEHRLRASDEVDIQTHTRMRTPIRGLSSYLFWIVWIVAAGRRILWGPKFIIRRVYSMMRWTTNCSICERMVTVTKSSKITMIDEAWRPMRARWLRSHMMNLTLHQKWRRN